MAITNANVVPRLYAARVVAAYETVRVHTQRTNRTWQSMLNAGGNTIRIGNLVTPTVGDYDPTATPPVTYQAVDAGKQADINLSYQKYVAGKIDDIAELQSRPDLLDEYARQAAEQLAKQVDADVRAAMVASGAFTAGPGITIDHSAAFTANTFKFAQLHRLLDNAKLPRAGRWIIMGPYSAEALQTYALQTGVIGASPVSSLVNGSIGTFAGFSVYVESDANSAFDDDSGNGGADANATEDWLVGNDTSMAFVDQLSEIEVVRLTDAFATGLRGLYTYGLQSIWPDRLYKCAAAINKIPV